MNDGECDDGGGYDDGVDVGRGGELFCFRGHLIHNCDYKAPVSAWRWEEEPG